MDSDGGVYQDTVKDHVGVVRTLLSLSLQESSPRRQIPMNHCRTTLTNQTAIINGVQATSFIAGTYSGSTLDFYTPQAGAQAGRL